MNYTQGASHFIPPHFFQDGEFQVWAPRQEYRGGRFTGKVTMELIADNLTEQTAHAYKWQGMEVRRKGAR